MNPSRIGLGSIAAVNIHLLTSAAFGWTAMKLRAGAEV